MYPDRRNIIPPQVSVPIVTKTINSKTSTKVPDVSRLGVAPAYHRETMAAPLHFATNPIPNTC